MSTKHILTKHKIQEIPKKSIFLSLLDECLLSPEDKQIAKLYYLDNKTLGYIADILGYSESTIKKRHSKILKKIRKLL